MKNLMYVVGALLLSVGIVSASCMGPFCWDDRGAYINGSIFDGNGDGMPTLTKAQISSATARAIGQEVFCTDCSTFNAGVGGLCVSTATAVGSYIAISTLTAISVCK